VPFQYEYVADATFAKRATRSLFKYSLTRPRVLLTLVPAFILFPAFGGLLGQPDTPLLGFCVGVFADLAIAISFYTAYRTTLGRLAPVASEGSRYSAGFGPTSIALRNPLATSEISYAAYGDVFLRDGFVYLKARRGSGRPASLLPAELFPGDTLSFVRSKIREAN
jgi:hypothetical protein